MYALKRDIVATLLEAKSTQSAVLVVGLGVSGRAVISLLKKADIPLIAVESMSEAAFQQKVAKNNAFFSELLKDVTILWGVADGEVPSQLVDAQSHERGAPPSNLACAVVSPGVPLDSALLQQVRQTGVPVFSELEVGVALFRRPAVVITGSNGKSTTVSVAQHLIEACGQRSVLCGNIGLPVVSAYADAVPDVAALEVPHAVDCVVVEASSYQLEACHSIRPKVAVLLNLSENHLERHKTFEQYGNAKAQMFGSQTEDDLAILNVEDAFSASCAERTKARIGWIGRRGMFGERECLSQNPKSRNSALAEIDYAPERRVDVIRVRWVEPVRGGTDQTSRPIHELVVNLRGSLLVGLHNRFNLAAAILSVVGLGIDLNAHVEDIEQGIRSFQPLAHRLEFVPSDDSAPIIVNDSKATTVAATCEAVRAVSAHFKGRRVVLLLGGLAKQGSWHPLARALNEGSVNLKTLVFFGRDGPRIHAALLAEGLGRGVATFDEPHLASAAGRARMVADQGDVILFSPGCASFDEFNDFEERGCAFRSYIRNVEPLVPELAL